MKTIIVDDERIALQSIEKLVNDLGQLQIIDTFQDPRQALEVISQQQLDLVFLDIEMPELNGLEVAELIQGISPQTDIVFVTAYDEFAVQAFELQALDYILKPIQRERLVKTIQRVQERRKIFPTVTESTVSTLTIRCFQTLEFVKEGSTPELVPIRWRTSKAQELFAYLLHHRGSIVRKDALLDQLWPDTEWKKGFPQLYTTIYQIRKTLESMGIGLSINSQEGGYLLELRDVGLDVDQWEQGIRAAGAVSKETLSVHLRLLELYRGDYLVDYDYLWAVSERQRLKALWLHHALQVIEQLISLEKYADAIGICHRLQSLHPDMEESYFLLMQLYDQLGDRHAIEEEYQRLVAMLHHEFEAQPREHIQSWYQSWKERYPGKEGGS